MVKIERSAVSLKILYSESDTETLTSQAASIQKAGHQVETAAGRKAVEAAIHKASYDMVVLGPTLTRNDRHHLPYMVKKANIHTKVLVMHTDGERHPYVDANTDTGRSIEDVVAKISSLAPASAGADKKMAKAAGAGK
jgi:DNA-binding NtrC family response regulator